jgi:isocitrate dehydrogenase
MNSKAKNDPFDLNFKRKVRMKDFLVFKESNDDQDNYKIVEFEKTKEQNLKVLQFIQRTIKSNPDMNSSQVKDYLKRQRYFMKLYLEEVNKNSVDK